MPLPSLASRHAGLLVNMHFVDPLHCSIARWGVAALPCLPIPVAKIGQKHLELALESEVLGT